MNINSYEHLSHPLLSIYAEQSRVSWQFESGFLSLIPCRVELKDEKVKINNCFLIFLADILEGGQSSCERTVIVALKEDAFRKNIGQILSPLKFCP